MRYFAFLSYSSEDREAAVRLHRQLERWRTPRALRRPSPDAPAGAPTPPTRLIPIFRDRDELASGESLSDALAEALAASERLIVLCSPAAARSPWVNLEIEAFVARRGWADVHAVILDGAPPDCFPPALLRADTEPMAADLRSDRDGWEMGVLKLCAGLIGAPFGRLRDREAARRRQTLAAYAAATALFAGVAAVATWQFTVAEAARAETASALDRERAERARADDEARQSMDAIVSAISAFASLTDAVLEAMRADRIGRAQRVAVVDAMQEALWGMASSQELSDIRRTDFGRQLERASALLFNLGERRRSFEVFERFVEASRRLVDAFPQEPAYRSSLAASLLRASGHRAALGDEAGRNAVLEEAVALYRALATMSDADAAGPAPLGSDGRPFASPPRDIRMLSRGNFAVAVDMLLQARSGRLSAEDKALAGEAAGLLEGPPDQEADQRSQDYVAQTRERLGARLAAAAE